MKFNIFVLLLICSCNSYASNPTDLIYKPIGSSSDETCFYYGNVARTKNGHVTMWVKTICKGTTIFPSFGAFTQEEYDCNGKRSHSIANFCPLAKDGGLDGCTGELIRFEGTLESPWLYVIPNTIGAQQLNFACNRK